MLARVLARILVSLESEFTTMSVVATRANTIMSREKALSTAENISQKTPRTFNNVLTHLFSLFVPSTADLIRMIKKVAVISLSLLAHDESLAGKKNSVSRLSHELFFCFQASSRAIQKQ